jgi:TolB-like protein/Tfp pilus assembly protein PilF
VTPIDFAVSDRYRIVRELGRGGMATVYLAIDTRYDREAAIKVLDPDIAQGIAAERFTREIALAAKLTHPHIVPLLDSGTTDGRLWFVMPVLENQSLRERIDADKQLPIAEAVRIAREILSALDYAHVHDVVHRDIKPENILLTGGVSVLADFGLAKGMAVTGAALTQAGLVVGSAYYMSPEQAAGEEVIDGRSDLYSLGCVLYEMVTGEPPFVGKTVQSIMAKRFTEDAPRARTLRPALAPELDEVIAHALARSPADRYQSAAEFMAALEKASGSDPNGRPVSSEGGRRGRRAPFVAIAVTLVVLAATAAFALMRRGALDATPSIPRSIAVIPFTNLSDDKAQEYFSAGMTDEVLSAISSIKQLRVAGRASSYAAGGASADIKDIGRKLNVDAVLSGSVRREGDTVRVSVELDRVADGSLIWNAKYDRTMTDVFAMQEDIARKIAGKLDLGGNAQPVVRKATGDTAAYDLYLRGRHATDLRTAASLEQAADFFRKATDRDPLYARAWAGLADVYILQALNYYSAPADAYVKGKAAAVRALALDSTLAEANTSLGTVRYFYDRDFTGASAAYDRAIALDPQYPLAHYFYSMLLTGRDNARAEREADAAQRLDPLSPPMAQALGMVFIATARWDKAIMPLRAAIALEPNYYFPHAWLSLALAHAGTATDAVAEAQRAIALNPGNALVLAYLGEVYATTGNRRSAVQVAAAIDSISRTRPVCAMYVARIFDRLGDADRAFEWLDRAMAAHEGQLAQITRLDAFPTIKNDPRFVRLVKQLGLTQ